MAVELIVQEIRKNEFDVQIHVDRFPLFCPYCKNYLKEIYTHTGSRYGQVGSVECECRAILDLTDSDNIVEEINIHVRKLTTVLDFKELFQLRKIDFKKLENDYGYNIFEKHLNQTITLDSLILNIEKHIEMKISPFETEFPATIEIKKWLSLMKK